LGLGEAEASGLEVGEQALSAPAPSLIKKTVLGGRLRPGDHPRFLASLLLPHAHRRGQAAFLACGLE
jgi:hypothetical protein